MDLTNDGVEDIISGSYPGQLYVFAGKKDGTFAEGVKIQDKHGKDLNVGRAAAMFAADWDRDGDLDLVIGNIEGKVCFVANEGRGAQLVFGDPVWLEAGGTAIQVNGRNAGPCVADWDHDGNPDLVVGCGDGSVQFYRNQAEQGMPVLAAPVQLVGPTGHYARQRGATASDADSGRGTRSKVCVADWNGDGRLDLLVGDFGSSTGPEPDLTEAQKEERDRLQAERSELSKKYAAASERASEKLEAEYGYTIRTLRNAPEDKRAEIGKAWRDMLMADPDYQAYLKKSRDVGAKLRPLLPARKMQGHVWVFLQKTSRWL